MKELKLAAVTALAALSFAANLLLPSFVSAVTEEEKAVEELQKKISPKQQIIDFAEIKTETIDGVIVPKGPG